MTERQCLTAHTGKLQQIFCILYYAYSDIAFYVTISKQVIIFKGVARRLLMFIDELSPIFKEFTQHPVSFLGGLFSGVFRLNLADDPVRSWLDKQTGSTSYTS